MRNQGLLPVTGCCPPLATEPLGDTGFPGLEVPCPRGEGRILRFRFQPR